MKAIGAALAMVCLLTSLPAWGQSVESVVPNQGAPGASVEITITGGPDMFFYETSTITFSPAGDKITHGPLTLLQSNIAITTIEIAANTSPGMQDVTVTTSVQIFTGEDLFEVTGSSPDPEIVSVSPASATAGDSLTVTVTGSNTSFDSGSALAFSPNGIQIGTVTVQSPTLLEAQITIGAGASPGSRDVSVTSGAEVASGEGMFIVEAPQFTLVPDSGTQGETIASLTISGGPGGYSDQTTVDLGAGITIGAVSGAGSALTLTDVVIAQNAPVGPHDLTLTSPALVASGAFLVEQGVDTQLLSITPDHGDRGHPGLPVSLVGQNTHFDESGLTVVIGGSFIRAVDLVGVDATNLEAVLVIGSEAAEGAVDISVALGADVDCTNCELVSLPGGFEVTAPGTLTDADPWILEADQTANVSLSASDGQFVDGETVLFFEPPDGLEVLSLTIQDTDHLTAEVQVAEDAPGDPRDVIAVTGTEVALGPGLLDVYHPEIRRVAPNTALRNTNPSLTITGVDVPFDASTQVEFSGTGVTVGMITFDPEEPDEIVASVTVAADAPLGERDVSVTAGIIQVTGVGLFEVVEMQQKEEDGGCSCGALPTSTSALGVCLWGLLLFRRRRFRP